MAERSSEKTNNNNNSKAYPNRNTLALCIKKMEWHQARTHSHTPTQTRIKYENVRCQERLTTTRPKLKIVTKIIRVGQQ